MGWTVPAVWSDVLSSPHSLRWLLSSVLGSAVLADNLSGDGVQVTESVDDGQITRELKATITDPENRLLSDDPGCALAPWGQQLVVRAELSVGAAWVQTIPVGRFRIEEPEPDGGLSILQSNGSWLPAGQQVAVTGRDMLQQLADETWTTAVAPQSGATVRAEMARVLSGTGLALSPSVTSAVTVTSKADYGSSKLDALVTLAKLAGSVVCCDRAGAVSLVNATNGTGQTWTFDPGAQVGISRTVTMSRQSICNGVLVQGVDGDSRYGVRGSAWITSGPLRWGGPFGKIPKTISDQTIYSNTSATTRAQTELAKLTSTQTVTVKITAPANPAISVLDTASIPTAGMSGLIQTVDIDGDAMTLTVSIPWSQVWHD